MTDDSDIASKRNRNPGSKIGLPIRAFLFTLDQIEMMTGMTPDSVIKAVYFFGVDEGMQPKGLMLARNIADDDDHPDWRVAEGEFVRWMRLKGFRIYDRGWAVK